MDADGPLDIAKDLKPVGNHLNPIKKVHNVVKAPFHDPNNFFYIFFFGIARGTFPYMETFLYYFKHLFCGDFMVQWVIIKATLGMGGRKYDSDRRLVTYYNRKYNDTGIEGKDTWGVLILPCDTEKEKKRIHRIYKRFFPHCMMFKLEQVVPLEIGINFNYKEYEPG